MIATLLGLATLAFGASSTFVELHDAMITIWHVPPPLDRNHAATIIRLIRDRSYSFATALGIGFLLLVSLVLNAWIAAMRIALPRAATFVILYLVIAVLFAALYKIVPDVELMWSDVALGAMITSLLFMLGKQFMGLYFAHTSFWSTYGAAGSPIVVLLSLYYSAQLFFWGAEFSKVYKRIAGSPSGRTTLKGFQARREKVEELIGPDTVNTIPPATFPALLRTPQKTQPISLTFRHAPPTPRRAAYAALPEGRARFKPPTPGPRKSQTHRAPYSRSHTSQCPHTSKSNSGTISDSVRGLQQGINGRLNESPHKSAFLSIASARNQSS